MKAKTSVKEWLYGGLFFLCLISFLVSGILFFYTYAHQSAEGKEFEELAELIVSDVVLEEETDTQVESDETVSAPNEEKTVLESAERYAGLYERNNDFIGWLYIEGTGVNYPVMCTPRDPEYYIHRNFTRKYSYSGIPFFGEGCTLDSDNIIIYGHNMKNGTMFSDILQYADQEFWEQHPILNFNSMESYGAYEIFGAFYEKVHNVEENGVFRYYDYGGTLDEETFTEYVGWVKKVSAIDTGITPEYGEQLITLSTCAYHTQNGRFVVVARRMDPEQTESAE